MKKKILFIINPISGIGKQKKVEQALDMYLQKDKFDYQISYTSYAHHATALSLAAVLKGFDIVVAVGGDVQTAQNIHQRGLARAGGADDGHEFALLDVQVNVLQALDAIGIGFAYILELDQCDYPFCRMGIIWFISL